jgi:cellobiose phosphorylase
MKLTDIKLRGYGRFEEAPATFTIERFNLPGKWDYVYANSLALLRVKHDGGAYLQTDPPGGPAMFRQERLETSPAFFAWVIPDAEVGARHASPVRAFSNFWLPVAPCVTPGAEPDEFSCTFAPDAARWRVLNGGILVETELWVPPDLPAVVMTVRVTNASRKRRGVTVMPVLRPHMAPFSLAPWDVPHVYQTCAFFRLGARGMSKTRHSLGGGAWMETRDPGGVAKRRFRGAFLSDLDAQTFEVAGGAFVGAGEWTNPEAVAKGKLARRVIRGRAYPYGKVNRDVAAIGQPIVAALARKVALAPGKSTEFTVVFGKLPPTEDGALPAKSELTKLARYLKPDVRRRGLAAVRKRYAELFALRGVRTPDAAFDRYVNEWVPLQLDWVTLLDRGWPTGMRGTRDAAQDATGMVALDPALARKRLIEIFTIERTDGWFLRQYSTAGPSGVHDRRPYVDSACWVWEFLWKYLCYTRDFGILDQRLRWLDDAKKTTLLDHVVRLFDYYLSAKNIGEHGLVKIREGDWNDGINAAGLEGRGETVMVTCQVVLGLEQSAEVLSFVGGHLRVPPSSECRQSGNVGATHASPLQRTAARFRVAAKRFRANLLKHALNRGGYFSGLFNDDGKWIFTPRDPDGRSRINGPANSFAVIAGIARGKTRDTVFDALDSLKGPNGWRLLYPPLGDPPIPKLGRIGQGDKFPGLSENGTVYNHGAQGFLGRACWTAGRGTMLHRVLVYMFSYDQKCHPVDVQKSPPYAVVNHWREAPGVEGTGGDTFLSGSISTALRNVYQGIVGFRPGLTDLVIDPVVPSAWKRVSAELPFLGGRWRIRISNPRGVECGVGKMLIDGRPAGRRIYDARLDRKAVAVDVASLIPGADHDVEIVLG